MPSTLTLRVPASAYCNPQFLELETLGPRTILSPGETLQHREIWQLYDHVGFEPSEARARRMAATLAMILVRKKIDIQV